MLTGDWGKEIVVFLHMLCFVDESGDAGRKFGEGSSIYFTVAVVLFRDREEARADRVRKIGVSLLPVNFRGRFGPEA